MNDVKKHKQIVNGGSSNGCSGQSSAFYDSDYISSNSFSLCSLLEAEANAFSTRIDNDSVLAESVKCNQWSESVRSINKFGAFAEKHFDSFRKNGAIPFPQNKKNNKSGNILLGCGILDARWIALICFAVVIIAYKMVIVTVPYTSKESLFEVTSYVEDKFRDMHAWANENQILTRLNPFICGLVVSIFSVMLVYFDSCTPGVDPPSPFSPKSKQSYRQQRQTSIDLSYITAIASGIVVWGLMWFKVY